MENNKLWYVITCTHEHEQTNSKSSFLVRLVENLEDAKKLMQSIYDDAKAGRTGRHGIKYSVPQWLDGDKHRTLKVTSDINISGWLHSTTVETFHLSDEWESNIFSNKSWVLD